MIDVNSFFCENVNEWQENYEFYKHTKRVGDESIRNNKHWCVNILFTYM